ncbi:hypothetical protein 1 [Shuangao insect virus 9]|uniref:hypothetical protein 1 n=1 Tax=Shuangao insect virus 9 TaxID=1923470 RepID=UPI00090BABA9|nr:hypothetical protein 1 [Shuangao insect virus 9]APG75748.1 hypothetical protein 1 [Shuangao insect virus 9]
MLWFSSQPDKMVTVSFEIPEKKVSKVKLVTRYGWGWYRFIGLFWPIIVASQLYMLAFYLSLDATTWQFAFSQTVAEPVVRLVNAVFSTLVLCFVVYLMRGTMRLTGLCKDPTGSVTFEPERMRPGSLLMPHAPSKCQAELYGKTQGTWVRLGQAFRSSNYLVTASHVIDQVEIVKITTEHASIEVPTSLFRQVEGDLSIMPVTDQVLAPLKLANGRLASHEATEGSGLFVKIGGFGSGSLGMLKPNPAFGFVEYTGSTVPGFSGAPYVVGDVIYGMHLGGGAQNLGYSGAYISMLMRALQEDSTDFLMSQIERAAEYQVSQSPYDPDEFRVKVGGRYYLLDAEGVHKLNLRVQRDVSSGYRDYEPEGALPQVEKVVKPVVIPATSPKPPMARVEELESLLQTGNGPAPAENPVPAGATGQDSVPARPARRPRRRSPAATTSSATLPSSATDGQDQTPAQLRGALQDIADSLKMLRKELGTLQMQTSRRRLKESESASATGRLTSLRRELSRLRSSGGSQ